MSSQPKFSIIVPVYNAEEYIAQCLDSIEKQSYGDFEIICVNDGSTDKSLELLKKYGKDYGNITIVDQENQGAGAAKNAGIAKAKGEYIAFVDADDWLKESLLEECLFKIRSNPSLDVVVFGASTFHQNNGKTSSGQYSSKHFPKDFSYAKLFKFNTVACNKIYCREFILKSAIEFSRTKTGEDQIFFLKSMLLAKGVEILKKDLYFYRKGRSGSLTGVKLKKDFSPLDNFYTIADFVMQEKIPQRNKILSRYLLKAISWYAKTDKSLQDAYLSRLLEIFEYLKNNVGYGWWSYYSLDGKNTKLRLKLEYFKSVLIFSLKSLGRQNG